MNANAEVFLIAKGGETAAQLTIDGLPVHDETVTAIHRTDWQGRQLLYPTARTNVLPYSGSIGGTGWTLVSGATKSATAAPDGSNNASIITAGGLGTSRTQSSPIPVSAGASIPWRLFIAQGSAAQNRLAFWDSNVSTPLQNVPVTWTNGVPSAAGIVFTPIGGGWFLAESSFNSGAFTSARMLVYPDSASGTGTFLCYGAQVGCTGAYIPTTTAPVAVTDYTLGALGAVSLGQAATAGAVYDWDGVGTWQYLPPDGRFVVRQPGRSFYVQST